MKYMKALCERLYKSNNNNSNSDNDHSVFYMAFPECSATAPGVKMSTMAAHWNKAQIKIWEVSFI